MEITGKLKQKLEKKTGTGKTGNVWNTTSFVLVIEGQYEEFFVFELFNDKCDLIENIKVGEEITVKASGKASEYQGKWYNKLQAWDVKKKGQNTSAPAEQMSKTSPNNEPIAPVEENNDQLPF